MARMTEQINPRVLPAPAHILEKHFYRKHGEMRITGNKIQNRDKYLTIVQSS